MIAESVMSFGYRVPAWVLIVGLALVWVGGLVVTAPASRSRSAP